MLSLSKLFLSAGAVSMYMAAFPATSNYRLNDYSFGTGGGTGSTANYGLEGLTGELNGATASTANYSARSGLLATQLANVPAAPTVTNPSSWYNKLQVVIDTGGNPSDALFAIAVSDDSFATTNYVQSDMTIGPALGIEDYLTYAGWGSGSGSTISGLLANTSYEVKVKASRGNFTESGYSGTGSASTDDISLSFDIDVASTDTESGSPYSLNLGDLLVGTITSGTDKIWFDLDTNANTGGRIFLFSTNSGLRSTALTYTIASSTTDLSGSTEAVGLQSDSATQTSGGPLSAVSPYDGPGDNVGITDASIRPAYQSSTPILGGRTSMSLKAKALQTTPAADDYADILTIIAAANF
jgi:hypothetical protein